MANRNFNQKHYSYELEPVKIYGRLTIGASGAVVAGKNGLGILSIVKETAAGQYTITFQDTFAKFLFLTALAIDDAASNVAKVQAFEDPTTLQANLKADKKLTIQCLDFAGAAVNPTSGMQILLEVTMRQSCIGRGD